MLTKKSPEEAFQQLPEAAQLVITALHEKMMEVNEETSKKIQENNEETNKKIQEVNEETNKKIQETNKKIQETNMKIQKNNEYIADVLRSVQQLLQELRSTNRISQFNAALIDPENKT